MKAIPLFGSALGVLSLVLSIGEHVVSAGLNFAVNQVSALDTSAFSNAAFALVAGIGYANAVFPLSEFVNIWTSVFTAAGIVLVIRWVKSFIPTVAN